MGYNLNAHGYQETKAALPGEFVPLPAGGYVCNIVDAEITKSSKGNDMLVLYVDIADGEYRGYFKQALDRVKNFNSDIRWDNTGIYRQLILTKDNKIAPFFKGLIGVIEKSNDDFVTNFNDFEPADLKGKFIGVIFGEEEYVKPKDQTVGTRTFAKTVADVHNIWEGKFTVPKKKLLDRQPDINVGDNPTKPIEGEDPPF